MKNKIHRQMEEAIKKIAKKINSRNKPPAFQETNIFKILKLTRHELRHAAFLEFLLDPERNPLLAKYFLQAWVAEIILELNISDPRLEDIINNNKSYEINPIQGETKNIRNNYSEITTSKNKRIDHALEVSLSGTKRVFVFEYKYDGVLQNNLDEYKNYIEKLYGNNRATIYYFILELAHKKHDKPKNEDWRFISRNTLINALEQTLQEARSKDMQATRLYLEQYLEILQPNLEGLERLRDLREELWSFWNPEVAEIDPYGEHFVKLVNSYIDSEENQELLNSNYNYNILFDWAVIEAVDLMPIITTRLNKGWIRIILNNSFKNLYLSTCLYEANNCIYMDIIVNSWHDSKLPKADVKPQYELVKKAVQKNRFSKDIKDFDNLRFLRVTNKDKILERVNHPSNCKTPYQLKTHYSWEINFEQLKSICLPSADKPEIFNEWLKEIEWWVKELS